MKEQVKSKCDYYDVDLSDLDIEDIIECIDDYLLSFKCRIYEVLENQVGIQLKQKEEDIIQRLNKRYAAVIENKIEKELNKFKDSINKSMEDAKRIVLAHNEGLQNVYNEFLELKKLAYGMNDE